MHVVRRGLRGEPFVKFVRGLRGELGVEPPLGDPRGDPRGE